jgi:hypothetical protein
MNPRILVAAMALLPLSRGPSPLGRGDGLPLGITLSATKDGAFDGTFGVGAPSFSPPAAQPMTARQQAKIEIARQQLDARRVYDERQFARGAALFSSLAKLDAPNRGDHAYEAACCYALAGDTAHAFAALDDALAHGFADVKTLESDARWSPLVTRAHQPRQP